MLFWTGLSFAAAFGVCLADTIRARFPAFFWIVLPIASVGASVGFFAILILILLARNWAKVLFLRVEGIALARARKVARREGEVTRLGGTTFWCSGPDDPVPMLTKELETTRQRFAAMFAVPDAGPRRLRFFCFATRAGFEAYHGSSLNLSSLEGVYQSVTGHTATLCTEPIAHRLTNTESTARTLFAFVLLEKYVGGLQLPGSSRGSPPRSQRDPTRISSRG